jgi:hypothetical protein
MFQNEKLQNLKNCGSNISDEDYQLIISDSLKACDQNNIINYSDVVNSFC